MSEGHACGTHRPYRLTCDEFDELRTAAAGRCQRCDQSAARLMIDHDHAGGMAAVRGLVCALCNTRLREVDGLVRPRNELDDAYLDAAWHRGRAVEFFPTTATKLRSLRVDVALWAEAKRIADERRETLSAVMKRALVEYVEQHGGTVER